MKIMDLLRPECVVPKVALTNKAEALEKIAEVAKQCKLLKHVDKKTILEGLQQREELGSTGFTNGIAIPHCRLPEVEEFVVGLLTVPSGVDFESLDGKKVTLIVFIIAPENDAHDHLSLLSEVSHTLRIPGVIEELTAATAPEALTESFLRHCRGDVDKKDHNSKNLFHIHVTNEDIFHELLQVLVSLEPATLTVVEATQASEYLAKIPIFAGFWSDREQQVCRIIVAQIEKRLTNEAIRRIEEITGSLNESSEVSVSIQDLFYSAGLIKD